MKIIDDLKKTFKQTPIHVSRTLGHVHHVRGFLNNKHCEEASTLSEIPKP